MDSPENFPVKPQDDAPPSAFPVLPALQMFNIAGHFAGAIAHDFNNILTGVLGNLELMQRRANRLGVVDFNDYLAGARSAAQRGVEFSQSLLAIAGHQPLESKAIEATSLFANVTALLRADFGDAIAIHTQLAPNNAKLLGDEAKLEDAVVQLGRNAMQSEQTTCVTFTAEAAIWDEASVSHYGISAGPYIAITVQDDGAGMTEETSARAFEPFFSTKGAAGIGLAKTLGFARQSGGHAFITNHQPGNTTITLLLPQAG